MATKINICPDCFRKLNEPCDKCPVCGFNIKISRQNGSALESGLLLNSRYLIGRVIGQGGFGITYKAYDTFKNQVVAIKEYMPSDYADREGNAVHPKEGGEAAFRFLKGKDSYIKEIRSLCQFDDTEGVVKFLNHFEENNTVYLVMEYLEGETLNHLLSRNGGNVTVITAYKYISKVAEALERVHAKNVYHRDITPENIFITDNGESVKLIDFGSARTIIENDNEEKTVLLKPDYAPPEQYDRRGHQGAWTDVYALAATLYRSLTSEKDLQAAKQRQICDDLKPLDQIVPQVTPEMAAAVSHAMELKVENRTQNCREFLKELDAAGWRNKMITEQIGAQTSAPDSGGFSEGKAKTKTEIMCIAECIAGSSARGHNKTFCPNETIRVGRDQVNDDLVLPEKFITKGHFTARYDSATQAFFVTDNSTNGTFTIQGGRLPRGKECKFQNGSVICLTERRIQVKLTAYYT